MSFVKVNFFINLNKLLFVVLALPPIPPPKPSEVCSDICLNGGTCVPPDDCKCPSGYKGTRCEKDVDECKEFKPCDQICYNTKGSFKCECKENFQLQSDGQTCRKESKYIILLEI